jgi:hypothetical protein
LFGIRWRLRDSDEKGIRERQPFYVTEPLNITGRKERCFASLTLSFIGSFSVVTNWKELNNHGDRSVRRKENARSQNLAPNQEWALKSL